MKVMRRSMTRRKWEERFIDGEENEEENEGIDAMKMQPKREHARR